MVYIGKERYQSTPKSAEAAGSGVLGVNSGTLHLILLAGRKVWTNPFFAFISHTPSRTPLILLLFPPFRAPPLPPPCPPRPPPPTPSLLHALCCFIFCHRAGLRQPRRAA